MNDSLLNTTGLFVLLFLFIIAGIFLAVLQEVIFLFICEIFIDRFFTCLDLYVVSFHSNLDRIGHNNNITTRVWFDWLIDWFISRRRCTTIRRREGRVASLSIVTERYYYKERVESRVEWRVEWSEVKSSLVIEIESSRVVSLIISISISISISININISNNNSKNGYNGECNSSDNNNGSSVAATPIAVAVAVAVAAKTGTEATVTSAQHKQQPRHLSFQYFDNRPIIIISSDSSSHCFVSIIIVPSSSALPTAIPPPTTKSTTNIPATIIQMEYNIQI